MKGKMSAVSSGMHLNTTTILWRYQENDPSRRLCQEHILLLGDL